MAVAPYSLRSFRALAERESRRGRDISRVDPSVKNAVAALRTRREQYRNEIATFTTGSPLLLASLDNFRADRKILRENRDNALEDALQKALTEFEEALVAGTFSFDLAPAVNLGGRQTYRISDSLSVAFPAKQAGAIIRDLYSANAQSRNGIVRALKEALGKKYSHAIYRLDITSFFDSIPHHDLLNRLRSLKRLDTVTSLLISRLLDEFAALTGAPAGVPQGVGMSSCLADFYLHEFDRLMKATPGVLFYARYVDDIVLVLEDEDALERVKVEIDYELLKLGLTKHPTKTEEIVTEGNGDHPSGSSLEYLGYRFTRANGILTTGLTVNRQQRRMRRLKLSLKLWLDSLPDPTNPNHGHDGMLIDRLRYLAGNTKLLNSKDNVAIGLFFSNSALDADATELADLDAELDMFRRNHSNKMSEKLQNKLNNISFVEMFRQRSFYRFNQRRVQRVIQAWEERTP